MSSSHILWKEFLYQRSSTERKRTIERPLEFCNNISKMKIRHVIFGLCLYLCLGGIECRKRRQTSSPCDPNPCINGGTCTVNGNDYTCACTDQFRGRDCESTGKCSAGWEIYGEKCFKFSSSTLAWDASKSACENEENGYLAEIFSEGENRFLAYTGSKISTLTSGCWFGLKWHNDWDTFYWIYSNVVYTYKNWLGGYGTGFANKYCYKFDQSNGLWSQLDCTTNSNYICEKAAEDDPCFPNPCQNDGTCSANGNDYTCNCPAGSEGKNCETSGYCEPGWAHYGRKCFKFSSSTKTWEASKTACQTEENGYLAEIFNVEENNLLKTTGSAISTLTSGCWFGIKWDDNADTFIWQYSNVPYTYQNWLGGSAGGFSSSYCYKFDQSSGYWSILDCSTLSNYICEKDVTNNPCTALPCKNGGTCIQHSGGYTCTCVSGYSGSNCEKSCPSGWSFSDGQCYKYTNAAVNWSTAKSQCTNAGGTLAQINSDDQNDFLHNLRGNYEAAWIGLNDADNEGAYVWDGSGASASYTKWNYNEPNNGAGTGEEDCVEMSGSKLWNDFYCSGLKGYFCQRSQITS